MAMAFLEEEVDEGLFDEVLRAATDAIRQKNQQHRQFLHPAPLLSSTAPQKKLAITDLPSSKSKYLKPPSLPSPVAPARNQCADLEKEVLLVAKCPQISSVNNYQSSYKVHRDASVSSGVAKDLNQQGFVKNEGGGTRNRSGPGGSDVKANGHLKTGGPIVSRGGGRGGDVKQEVYPRTGYPASAAWSGRRPFQELQPWFGSHEIVERPSSTGTWVQAEKTRCSANENDVAWFSGLSGVAVFKECQEAAMRTLVPSDYTMMNGKPFIKKTGWRKIAFFFNLSFEIKDKNIQFDQQANVLRAEFVVRASMPYAYLPSFLYDATHIVTVREIIFIRSASAFAKWIRNSSPPVSGRFTDSWGSCDRGEKRFSKPNHDIPSTAETRAKTRACQDLLGIGEYKSDGCQ